MRRLVMALVVLAVLYSGYWYVMATIHQAGLQKWFEARRTEGWVAEYEDISVRGFPFRFDTRITGLELVDTRSGLAWNAPWFRFVSQSWRPAHVRASWPPEQLFATPEGKIVVNSRTMQGVLGFDAWLSLPLRRAEIDLGDLSIRSSRGWTLEMQGGRLSILRTSEPRPTYDVNLDARALSPALELFQVKDPAGLLPDAFESFTLKSRLVFDAPWDIHAITQRRPQPRAIRLEILKAKWGILDIWAAGKLKIDEEGWPTGQVSLKVKNWREVLEIAIASGWLPPRTAGDIEKGLSLLARVTGNPKSIDTTIRFASRRAWIGPLPIGPAPRIRLR